MIQVLGNVTYMERERERKGQLGHPAGTLVVHRSKAGFAVLPIRGEALVLHPPGLEKKVSV